MISVTPFPVTCSCCGESQRNTTSWFVLDNSTHRNVHVHVVNTTLNMTSSYLEAVFLVEGQLRGIFQLQFTNSTVTLSPNASLFVDGRQGNSVNESARYENVNFILGGSTIQSTRQGLAPALSPAVFLVQRAVVNVSFLMNSSTVYFYGRSALVNMSSVQCASVMHFIDTNVSVEDNSTLINPFFAYHGVHNTQQRTGKWEVLVTRSRFNVTVATVYRSYLSPRMSLFRCQCSALCWISIVNHTLTDSHWYVRTSGKLVYVAGFELEGGYYSSTVTTSVVRFVTACSSTESRALQWTPSASFSLLSSTNVDWQVSRGALLSIVNAHVVAKHSFVFFDVRRILLDGALLQVENVTAVLDGSWDLRFTLATFTTLQMFNSNVQVANLNITCPAAGGFTAILETAELVGKNNTFSFRNVNMENASSLTGVKVSDLSARFFSDVRDTTILFCRPCSWHQSYCGASITAFRFEPTNGLLDGLNITVDGNCDDSLCSPPTSSLLSYHRGQVPSLAIIGTNISLSNVLYRVRDIQSFTPFPCPQSDSIYGALFTACGKFNYITSLITEPPPRKLLNTTVRFERCNFSWAADPSRSQMITICEVPTIDRLSMEWVNSNVEVSIPNKNPKSAFVSVGRAMLTNSTTTAATSVSLLLDATTIVLWNCSDPLIQLWGIQSLAYVRLQNHSQFHRREDHNSLSNGSIADALLIDANFCTNCAFTMLDLSIIITVSDFVLAQSGLIRIVGLHSRVIGHTIVAIEKLRWSWRKANYMLQSSGSLICFNASHIYRLSMFVEAMNVVIAPCFNTPLHVLELIHTVMDIDVSYSNVQGSPALIRRTGGRLDTVDVNTWAVSFAQTMCNNENVPVVGPAISVQAVNVMLVFVSTVFNGMTPTDALFGGGSSVQLADVQFFNVTDTAQIIPTNSAWYYLIVCSTTNNTALTASMFGWRDKVQFQSSFTMLSPPYATIACSGTQTMASLSVTADFPVVLTASAIESKTETQLLGAPELVSSVGVVRPFADASATVLGMATAMSAATNWGSGLALQRSVATLNVLRCLGKEGAMSQPMDIGSSPLQWELGSGPGNYARGAVAGNLLLCGLGLCVGFGAAFAVMLRKARQRPPPTLWEAASTIGFPVGVFPLLTTLSGPTVTASVSLAWLHNNESSIALAVVGLSSAVGLVVSMAAVLRQSAFCTRTVRVQRLKAPKNASRYVTQLFRVGSFLSGRTWQWQDNGQVKGFVGVYGKLFQKRRPSRQWWGALELGISLVSAASCGLLPSTSVGCTAAAATSIVCSALLFVLLVLLRPHDVWLETAQSLFSNGMACITSLVALLLSSEDSGAVSTLVAVQTVTSFVFFVLKGFGMWTQRKHNNKTKQSLLQRIAVLYCGNDDGEPLDNTRDTTDRKREQDLSSSNSDSTSTECSSSDENVPDDGTDTTKGSNDCNVNGTDTRSVVLPPSTTNGQRKPVELQRLGHLSRLVNVICEGQLAGLSVGEFPLNMRECDERDSE